LVHYHGAVIMICLVKEKYTTLLSAHRQPASYVSILLTFINNVEL
jgi:hypothetical protein